jgi:hypothetical protein
MAEAVTAAELFSCLRSGIEIDRAFVGWVETQQIAVSLLGRDPAYDNFRPLKLFAVFQYEKALLP